jgi:hypothetical protein
MFITLNGNGGSWLPETPRNPEAAFLGFCRKWMQNRKDTG